MEERDQPRVLAGAESQLEEALGVGAIPREEGEYKEPRNDAIECLVLSMPCPTLFPGDGVDFLSWFLNALHSALGGTKKKKKSKSCLLH